jgi:hypothetical protein
VLTKLDGTAKGGIALAIARELGIPVKLIGVGEQLEDLRPFDAEEFARALIGPRSEALARRCGAGAIIGPRRVSWKPMGWIGGYRRGFGGSGRDA